MLTRLRHVAWLIVLATCLFACSEGEHGNDTNALLQDERIVVIAPAMGEMLQALELDQFVVGRGEYGPWSKKIEQTPVVGGYNNPNAEIIKQLKASIVMNTFSQAAIESHQRLSNVGIEVMALDTSTVDGIYHSIHEIGQRFDRVEQAAALNKKIQDGLQAIRQQAANAERHSVLFVVGKDPLFVAGPGSHVDYLINLAGGVNIIQQEDSPYQQISMETVLQRQPDIIIDSSDVTHQGIENSPGFWAQFPDIPAVRQSRVYRIDSSLLLIPGIHLTDMARLTGQLIQPEIFGTPNPTGQVEQQP